MLSSYSLSSKRKNDRKDEFLSWTLSVYVSNSRAEANSSTLKFEASSSLRICTVSVSSSSKTKCEIRSVLIVESPPMACSNSTYTVSFNFPCASTVPDSNPNCRLDSAISLSSSNVKLPSSCERFPSVVTFVKLPSCCILNPCENWPASSSSTINSPFAVTIKSPLYSAICKVSWAPPWTRY